MRPFDSVSAHRMTGVVCLGGQERQRVRAVHVRVRLKNSGFKNRSRTHLAAARWLLSNHVSIIPHRTTRSREGAPLVASYVVGVPCDANDGAGWCHCRMGGAGVKCEGADRAATNLTSIKILTRMFETLTRTCYPDD